MAPEWIEPEYLVWSAGGLYIIGYLIINQVILRLVFLMGTGFYILYYLTAAEPPLWEAVYTSSLMGLANILGLTSLIWRNSKLAVPARYREIYKSFKDLPPGDFRDLVLLTRQIVLEEDQIVTRENSEITALYYVVSGKLEIEKMGERFEMPAGVFVGEVAYLTGRKSSATTRICAGSELLEWDIAQLRARSRRKARFRLALEAAISKDLALKVVFAVAPHRSGWDPSEATEAAKKLTNHLRRDA